MKRINCDHKNKTIYLYPDFSSTGMWCECGISFGNPKKDFPDIPEGVFDLVQLWNNYWEETSFIDHHSYFDGITPEMVEYHERKIMAMGKYLCKIISEYMSCIFVEDNARINLEISNGRKQI